MAALAEVLLPWGPSPLVEMEVLDLHEENLTIICSINMVEIKVEIWLDLQLRHSDYMPL